MVVAASPSPRPEGNRAGLDVVSRSRQHRGVNVDRDVNISAPLRVICRRLWTSPIRACSLFAWCIVLILPSTRPVRAEGGEDGQWPMVSKNYAQTRFSGLDQITTKNAKDLKVAWTFSTGIDRGQEAAPIVVGTTMYVVTPFPNILYALDLKDSGAVRWKYEPKPVSAAQGVACCDVVNRGAAYDQGKIFFNTLDCHTIAVDAETGKELWKTK